MTHQHVCVWIDQYEAKVFGLGREESDLKTISDSGPHHHIHRRADHVGLHKDHVDRDFLAEVGDALLSAKAILIVGPGLARSQLAGFLHERYPAVAKRIWSIEAMDHPTDAQIVAAARSYFKSADRMHASGV